MPPRDGKVRIAAGLSVEADTIPAIHAAIDNLQKRMPSTRQIDLAVVFFSPHHVPKAAEIAAAIATRLGPRILLGVSAEGVVSGRIEVERSPGISVMAASLPGVTLTPFSGDDIPVAALDDPDQAGVIASAIGARPDLRAVMCFADPFSVPLVSLVPALNRARPRTSEGRPTGIIFGGVASGSTKAGGNRLLLNDRLYLGGLVGVGISGPVRIETIVSQGCRGFGPTMVVTKAKRNLILELGGRNALEVVRELAAELPESRQQLLRKGLFVGRVVNEYKDRFGRDDFLVRNVMGADEDSGALALADFVRVGQTIRLHLRDAASADEDLAMLLDGQKLHGPPAGVMLITCNARGLRLFPESGHDATAIVRAFSRLPGGPESAKIGEAFEPGAGRFPLAGMFATGEIGPVGDESYLHGHTACAAIFRDPAPEA